MRAAGLAVNVRGRMQVVADDPLTVLDGAHNPDAARALVESLPALLAGRRLVIVMGGARGQGRREHVGGAAAAVFAGLVHRSAQRSRPLAGCVAVARPPAGFRADPLRLHPWRALEQAQDWPRAQSDPTAVLATGSVYLVGDLLASCAERGESTLGGPATSMAEGRV